MAKQAETGQAYFRDDDLSLKDILLKVKAYWAEVLKNWKIVLALVVLFVGIMLVRAFLTPKKYEAELTFVVNEDEGSQLGGVASMLATLGLGSATNSEYNLEKILDLMKSRRIISKTLLEKAVIGGKEDFLANHLIRTYELHEKWKKKEPKLEGLFFTHDSLQAFSRLENRAMTFLYMLLVDEKKGDNLLTSSISESSGIMSIKLVSKSEELSEKLLQQVFSRLSHYYIDQTTRKQRETHELVVHQADSIRGALQDKERQLAVFVDQNQYLVSQQAQLKKENIERDLFILNTMYAEAAKNVEISRFALQNKTPFIQAIDYPVMPLKVVQVKKLTSMIFGAIAGFFIALIFLVGRKFLRDAMQEA